MPAPSLTRLDPPAPPTSVVLLLRGGKPRGRDEVGARSASWHRMAALQRATSARLHEAGVASWLLRYRERGWNGTGTSATEGGRWALDQVRSEVGVVALAPWWDRSDPLKVPPQEREQRRASGRSLMKRNRFVSSA